METERADFLVRGAMVYNSYFKKFVPADVSVSGGKFLYIDSRRSGAVEADETVDAEGLYMVPGLIDIHMHIESSMLTPGAFCRRLAECGVTTIVSEPHEMANVNGMQGVLDMIRAGENSPVDIFYGIPSCVPSTSPELETTGGCQYGTHSAMAGKTGHAVNRDDRGNRQADRLKLHEIAGSSANFSNEKGPGSFPLKGHCLHCTRPRFGRFCTWASTEPYRHAWKSWNRVLTWHVLKSRKRCCRRSLDYIRSMG